MEEKEFRQRVMALQRLMYTVALKVGLPPDDAADAVQETQLSLWRGRSGIPPDDAGLKAYCMAALRNYCITWLLQRRDSISLASVTDTDVGTTTSSEAEDRDTRQYIEKAIDSLPPGQRDVIRLSGLGGLDTGEIAEATGMKSDNVRQLLSRGRRRLKEIFIKDKSSITPR